MARMYGTTRSKPLPPGTLEGAIRAGRAGQVEGTKVLNDGKIRAELNGLEGGNLSHFHDYADCRHSRGHLAVRRL